MSRNSQLLSNSALEAAEKATLGKYVGLKWGLGIVAVSLGMWELLVRWNNLPPYLLPTPSHILSVLIRQLPALVPAALWTLGEAMSGLLLGVTSGILIALLARRYPRLESGIMWLAVLVKSTPVVAIAPLLTLWLGFGILPKVILTALMTFFPVLVNVLAGFSALRAEERDWMYSIAAAPADLLHYAEIPAALPYLFAALRVVAPLALVGAIVAEWAGASSGLGRLMWLAYTNLNIPLLFSAIVLLALQGALLYQMVIWLESRVLFWRVQPTKA